MPRQAVFTVDTILYHPIEGAYAFPAGSPDPGNAWTDKPGGDAPGKESVAQAMKDLVAAQDHIEALQRQLASVEHDKANLAMERDAANAQAAVLRQEIDDLRAKLAIPAVDPAYADPVSDKRTAERAGVEIPADWEILPFFSKKALAAKLTDQPVATKAEVESAIRAHLAQAQG